MLVHTGVANYMEFRPVDGRSALSRPSAHGGSDSCERHPPPSPARPRSFVYRSGGSGGGKVHKVPVTPKEAMYSKMMNTMEKTPTP